MMPCLGFQHFQMQSLSILLWIQDSSNFSSFSCSILALEFPLQSGFLFFFSRFLISSRFLRGRDERGFLLKEGRKRERFLVIRSPRRCGCAPKNPFELAGGLLRFKINAKMSNDLQTAVPKTPKPVSPNWVVSLVVSVLSLLLPGWKTQLQMFLKLENEVEKVIENTAEAVDKIAEEAEKVMEQVEHDLPEGSKLKETVLMLEHATEEAQKDAKLAIDLIHKVDEIKDEVEAVVDPVTNPVEFIKKEA